jgi:hypothetical protein
MGWTGRLKRTKSPCKKPHVFAFGQPITGARDGRDGQEDPEAGLRDTGFHVREPCERVLSDIRRRGFSDGDRDPVEDDPFASQGAGKNG